MRILIDNSNLYAGGGIQVASSFLSDLAKIESKDKYFVIQSVNSNKALSNKVEENERFVLYNLDLRSQSSIKYRIRAVKEIEERVKPDIIFTVFGPSYHRSNFPKVVGFAIGHILYNKSIYYKRLGFIELCKIRLSNYIKDKFFKRNSDVLIFETDDANNIYSKRLKEKIPCYTVSNTLNSIFSNNERWQNIEISKSSFDILYLTANYLHKNIDIIPKIIDKLIAKEGTLDFKFHISVTKEELGFDDKYDRYINYLGKVSLEKIPNLYGQMDVLLMPTLLEIFSASYLEAMFMGIPIVASDLSFANDICKDSALYASPVDSDDYSNKLLMLYKSHRLRDDLIQKGKVNLKRFGSSMDRTLKYLEILKKYAKENATDKR